jgi:hypothetical protein
MIVVAAVWPVRLTPNQNKAKWAPSNQQMEGSLEANQQTPMLLRWWSVRYFILG